MDPTFATAAVADRSDDAARAVAELWDLPAPVLLRRAGNAVYAAGDTVLRITPNAEAAHAQRALMAWLAVRDYPVDSVLDGHVVKIDGLDVSGWARLDNTGHPDLELVGASIRRLHGEDPAEVEAVIGHPLATMFPPDFTRTRKRLEEPGLDEIFDPRGIERCLGALDLVEPRLRSTCADLVVVHGDLQATNILAGGEGTRLIDFECLALAPRWWDMAKMTMFAHRFDPDGWWDAHLPEMFEAYGVAAAGPFDQETLDPWVVYALLHTTAGCLAKRTARPELGVEGARRLQWWAGDANAPLWEFL